MKKAVKWGILAAGVVAIIAAIVAVVLVVVLKKNPEPSKRVMHFAMHLGDDEEFFRNRHNDYKSGKCSLKMNVDNTRKSITAMKDVDQLYSLILFTDKVETTEPMNGDDAIAKLNSLKPTEQESSFSQEAVLKEFSSRSGGENRLVYYIPCSFEYRYDDEDLEKFVEEMKKARLEEKILIVSNTRPVEDVKELYELSSRNVAGSDTPNVVERISDFGRNEYKSTVEPPETSTKRRTSTTPAKTKTSTKTTTRTRTPEKSTLPPKPTPSPDGLHCLFVGDMYNFGATEEHYQKEATLIGDLGYDLFEEKPASTLGLWAYGYTSYPKSPDLKKTSKNYEEFHDELRNMAYRYTSDPLTTSSAIGVINSLKDDGSATNCLVFFSARQDTQSLPKLNPQNKKLKTIVAVGFNNTDLTGVVGSRGVAVSVPYHYVDSDVADVLDAIMGRYKPKTTTRKPTTPVPPSDTPKCLLVGDLYSFAYDVEKYEIEADLMRKVGYDFFNASIPQSALALWAYGYTSFSKTVNDSLKATARNYKDFVRALDKMDYVNIPDPLSLDKAIKAINEMYDNDNRVNCLVLFSAQQSMYGLPVLNPRNTKINRIIGVGLNGANLQAIIPKNGIAITVPYHYLDSDVTTIVNAMLGGYGPTTTTKTTKSTTTRTTPTGPPPPKVNCLVVADMYNFGRNADKYEAEQNLLAKVGYDFFEETRGASSIALWAYGHTNYSKVVVTSLQKMIRNYKDLADSLESMVYVENTVTYTTEGAINAINALVDNDNRVDCLVFLSAQKDSSLLPKLNPRYTKIKRIVAVGYDGADVDPIVPQDGVALSIPFHYWDDHVSAIVKAMLGRYKPTPKPPTTTTRPTPAPSEIPKCLLVGDLYNFGHSAENYDIEADLIGKVGYDFFQASIPQSAIALWAYGYTSFSKTVNDSLKTIGWNYKDFIRNLEKMDYVKIDAPLSTERAIRAINEMYDKDNRVNCLVFFSAQRNTEGLPQLDPRNTKINKIIAVGFNGANLRPIVPGHGVALTVPFHYLDGDVTKIVKAMIGSYTPTTVQTKKTTTTKVVTTAPPSLKTNCLMVADMYNFGRYPEKYEAELNLLANVGYDFFQETNGSSSSIALWAYGHTNFSKVVVTSLQNMMHTYKELAAGLESMVYVENTVTYTTEGAINAINSLVDNNNRVNCLVFFSAQKNSQNLPKLNPKYTKINRVVAVGYDGANVEAIVQENGVAVSIPFHYLDDHVTTIVNAMLGRYKPTPRPTTTRPTTTAQPDIYNCLFVGDLYNYEDDVDAYNLEADLIADVVHDLFDGSISLHNGLWAYGYTKFSKYADSAFEKMRKNYSDFIKDLNEMEYYKIDYPLSTADAIEQLSRLIASKEVLNCLVFFSAQQYTQNLPYLHPVYLPVRRTVAVGLNNTDLSRIVRPDTNGVAVSVPLHYLDSDVNNIIKAIKGSYIPPTTTTPKPTTTPPPLNPHCLFVGDMYNYGDDIDSYDAEGELLNAVGYDLFTVSPASTIGLWAYGYTNFSKYPSTSLEKMRWKYADFKKDLNAMEYVRISDPLTTKTAIEAINELRDNWDRFDCLVFFSAVKNTQGLPRIDPKYVNLQKILAVGLNNANLNALIPSNGMAVRVPKNFLDEDVTRVVDAIRKRTIPVTTRKPTTTTKKVTTAPTPKTPECLIVGDLYNFGSNVDSYEQEGDLINSVAHDIFAASPRSTLGLWAYGHTNFSRYPSSSLEKMRKNYHDFKKDLDSFDYVQVSYPLSTKTAIEVINAMVDNWDRFNCLVFLSAVRSTNGLPLINPRYLSLERIVAVGLNYANLNALVPATNGIAVTLPKEYLDEDVKRVVDAIMGRIKPTTTTTTTTRRTTTPTPTTTILPPITPDCLIVGDMYNFAYDIAAYEYEANLIDAVAYDLFEMSNRASLGLWLYGYTNFSKDPSPFLDKIRKNYDDFKEDMEGMEFIITNAPLTTKGAIEALNGLRDNGKRVNCLVFISAANTTKGLPQLDPKQLGLQRVVGVGFNKVHLDEIMPHNGVAVSVPVNFLDEHVKLITDAVMGRIKPVTKKPTTVPPPTSPKCLFVGDLFNFGSLEDAYDMEADLIDAIGYDLFDISSQSSLGLWAYGNTNFPKSPSTSLDKLREKYAEFRKDVESMEYVAISDPLTTKKAIEAINEMRDNGNRINCLVFFSAIVETAGLPRLNPQYLELDRIVAVGLAGVDLNGLLTRNGVAVSVPYNFLDEHVKLVTDAIMGRHKPTTKPTTKPPPTTVPSVKPPECLIVGDLFNFGYEVDDYEIEADLIDAVGYDLFDVSSQSSLGLWAYGYTNFSKTPSTSLEKMRKKYIDFKKDLASFGWFDTSTPMATSKAINALNEMRDDQNRINCLVFFSALANTKNFPRINPQHLKLDRIVAVGLNNVDLSDLVTSNGIALSVPYHWLDEHAKLITDAVMGRYKPTPKPTTRAPPTTVPSVKPAECLIVGDLFNFGYEVDDYETEADLIDAVGYDLFDISLQSSLGLWAYGYTNFSKDPSTSLEKMRKKYIDFKKDLASFGWYDTSTPMATSKAINAINEMRDDQNRIKCLVFFSALENTKNFPRINPQHLKLERIVAVGLNSVDLSDLVTSKGIALSVPYNWLDEHVKLITDAIMGRYKPTPKPTTKAPLTTVPSLLTPECLIVGDLFNFGHEVDDYETEADLIDAVGYDLFDFSLQSSLGLWAYGYTNFSKTPNTSLEKMRKKYIDFKKDLAGFEYFNTYAPMTTSKAINAINEMRDDQNRINCLVFFSALKNAKGFPQINPQHLNLKRIVAVGLNGVDLSDLVTNNGIALRVPYNWLDEDVKRITDAVVGRYKPPSTIKTTTKRPTTTTKRPSTTMPVAKRRDCIIVADMYNFDADVEKYDQEGSFIADVAYDFLNEFPQFSLGLWAYGYTNFSKSVNSSLEKMSKDFAEFDFELLKMEYFRIADPLTTKSAIEAINAMYDTERRANCLIFISAQKNTRGLPKINPQHMQLDSVVAVGFDNTDLSGIVPSNGAAVRVPFYFMEQHVTAVLEAIVKEYSPTRRPELTTPTQPVVTTSAGPTKSDIHCVFAGDLLNYGQDESAYNKEKAFMVDIGKTLFEKTLKYTVGVWAYGNTNLSGSLKPVFANMTKTFADFEADINQKMQYKPEKPNCKTNTEAIQKLNVASDKNRNANCLVFFSGMKSTSGLPKLNPTANAEFKRVVAVSLHGIDLGTIMVPPKGVAVKASLEYTAKDVSAVVDSVLSGF